MKSILFVCLGNICRSSLAEGVAKAIASGLEIQIFSAGTSTFHNGEAPCAISTQIAKRHFIDISKQYSQHISDYVLNHFDMVIAMDENNLKDLKKMGVENLYKFGDFGFNGADVTDLYYQPEEANNVYNMIELGVKNILKSKHILL